MWSPRLPDALMPRQPRLQDTAQTGLQGLWGNKVPAEPCKSLRRQEDSVTEASAATLLLLVYAIAFVLP